MTAIEQMPYTPPDATAATVESMSFRRLARLNRGQWQRADFHVVAMIDEGLGAVTIDFVRYGLAPRSAVWIPAGAVHRWEDVSALRGDVVLFVPTAPVTPALRQLVATPGLGGGWTVGAGPWRLARAAAAHLRLEVAAERGAGSAREIPDLLVSALLARLEPPRVQPDDADVVFRSFQQHVEASFREHHDVSYYADALGYVPRTVTRAVLAATGVTAKAYITERLVLEAKRMLAHDSATVSRCAADLGFVDASHFSAAFHRVTGERPIAWRERMAGRARSVGS